MQTESSNSQHLVDHGISNEPFASWSQEFTFDQPQVESTYDFSQINPELEEKKADLLKKLSILQRKNNLTDLGDPSSFLTENLDLNPNAYVKLLEHTRKMASKLNEVLAQSSTLLSSYVSLGSITPERSDSEGDSLTYSKSASLDTNSTRDSDKSPEFNSIELKSKSAKSSKIGSKKAWDTEKDKLLLRLVCKYNKDWKKVNEGLFDVYQTKYSIDFLKERYKLLYYSNQKLKKYTKSSNLLESITCPPEEKLCQNSPLLAKKIDNGFKHKQYTDFTRRSLLDNMLQEAHESHNTSLLNNNCQEKEQLHLFYNNRQQVATKTVDLNWISFDFDKEFDAQDQLFERITLHE